MRHRLLVIVAIALLSLAACKNRPGNGQAATATDTIAPATAKPAPTTSTDEAMTGTVELQDDQDRSPAEGGVLTEGNGKSTDTAVASKRKTGAAAASRKQPVSQSRPAGRTQ